MTDTGRDLRGVALYLHPSTATVAELTACHIGIEVLRAQM
jgi:hypothetical protein